MMHARILPVIALLLFFGASAQTTAAQTTQQDVADYIEAQPTLVPGGAFAGEVLWMTSTALDVTHLARDRDPSVADVAFPFLATWLVMIDDQPAANWGHPNRWVFVDDNLSQHIELTGKEFPPTVWTMSGTEVPIACAGTTPAGCTSGTPSTSSAAPGGCDKSCLHAVLVSGGINVANNKPRYAKNLRSMYKKLRACGYPAANIFVYYADGNTPLDLDDADGDQKDTTGSDVTGTASETNVRGKIAGLCGSLDATKDVLFIYTTNHGAKAKGLNLWDKANFGKTDADEIYTPAEFGADTKNCKVCRLFVVMDQCYGGQFAGLAGDGNHANMAIYTAAKANEPSVCRQYMGHWEGMDPSTTNIGAMHTAVTAAIAAGVKTCTGGVNHCENCKVVGDCPGGTCDNDGGSTPQTAEGTNGNGNGTLCACWSGTGSGSATKRNCTNPDDLNTTIPKVGQPWISSTVFPIAARFLTAGPLPCIPLSGLISGGLLCNPSIVFGPITVTVTGTFFDAVPNDSSLCGFSFCVQAAELLGPGSWQLTNAYDCVIGS